MLSIFKFVSFKSVQWLSRAGRVLNSYLTIFFPLFTRINIRPWCRLGYLCWPCALAEIIIAPGLTLLAWPQGFSELSKKKKCEAEARPQRWFLVLILQHVYVGVHQDRDSSCSWLKWGCCAQHWWMKGRLDKPAEYEILDSDPACWVACIK